MNTRMTTGSNSDDIARRAGIIVPLVVALALLMETVDATVIVTALPTMAISLHTTPVVLKAGLTSYFLMLGLLIPVSGRAANQFGTRRVFRSALFFFMVGSVLCSLSTSVIFFIIARGIQGVGGAMMVPVGRLAILRSVPKDRMISAMGLFTIPAILGPILGPPLGGLITTTFGWKYIFYVNVPICAAAVVLATLYLDDSRERAPGPFDGIGFTSSALGCACVMVGLSTYGYSFISPLVSTSSLIFGLFTLAFCVSHSHRTSHPLLNFRLFKTETFANGVIGGAITRSGSGSLPFLMPLVLQLEFQISPFESGVIIGSTFIGAASVKYWSPSMFRIFGFRSLLTSSSVGNVTSILFTAVFCWLHILPGVVTMYLTGSIFRTIQYTGLNTIVYSDIEPCRMGQATSIACAGQELSMGLGVTIGGLLLQIFKELRHGQGFTNVDFSAAMIGVAIVSSGIVPFMRRLPTNAGSEVSGHKGR